MFRFKKTLRVRSFFSDTKFQEHNFFQKFKLTTKYKINVQHAQIDH